MTRALTLDHGELDGLTVANARLDPYLVPELLVDIPLAERGGYRHWPGWPSLVATYRVTTVAADSVHAEHVHTWEVIR